jgi:hypothetical protein
MKERIWKNANLGRCRTDGYTPHQTDGGIHATSVNLTIPSSQRTWDSGPNTLRSFNDWGSKKLHCFTYPHDRYSFVIYERLAGLKNALCRRRSLRLSRSVVVLAFLRNVKITPGVVHTDELQKLPESPPDRHLAYLASVPNRLNDTALLRVCLDTLEYSAHD